MKRLATIVLAAVMILSMCSAMFAVNSPFIRLVKVTTDGDVSELKAGEEGVYTIRIKNVGYMAAEPLTVTISGEHPFRPEASELVKDVNYLGGLKEMEVSFKVNPSPLAEEKIYEFDIIFTYKDEEENTQTNTEKAYVKIVNRNVEPILSVVKTETNVKPALAGVRNSFNLTIRNTGTLTANSIKATLSGFSAEGIMIDNDPATKVVGTLGKYDNAVVYFIVKPSAKLQDGIYPLTLTLEYTDDMGNKYTKELPVYYTIGGAESSEQLLEITDISYPSAIAEGQDFTVKYKVTNKSAINYENFVLNLEYPQETFLSKRNARSVIDLAPGETKEVSISMASRKNVMGDTYHCYITASVAGSEAPLAKEYLGLFVNSDSTGGSGNRPKLIVEKYEYGKVAKAGSEFDLVIYIKNTSESVGTQNIKVMLEPESGVFVPVDSSSSLFIESIAPGQVMPVTMHYKAGIDAQAKIYTVTVKMQYEDDKGNAVDSKNTLLEETEVLSLTVMQDAVLNANDPYVDPLVYQGDRVDVDIEFFNEGRAPITNLKVRVEGLDVRENSYYVGKFEPGQQDMFSVSAVAEKEGDCNGKFIFEYENPMGEVETKEVEFTFYVAPASEKPSDMGMNPWGPEPPVEPEDQKSGTNWMLIGGIALGVIILIIILVAVLKNKKKKRAQMRELDALFNDGEDEGK